MPIYEYKCIDCEQPFEELVISARVVDTVVCPSCESNHVEKKISTFASKIAGGSSLPHSMSSASSCISGST